MLLSASSWYALGLIMMIKFLFTIYRYMLWASSFYMRLWNYTFPMLTIPFRPFYRCCISTTTTIDFNRLTIMTYINKITILTFEESWIFSYFSWRNFSRYNILCSLF